MRSSTSAGEPNWTSNQSGKRVERRLDPRSLVCAGPGVHEAARRPQVEHLGAPGSRKRSQAAPTSGWPASGSSTAGVKMRSSPVPWSSMKIVSLNPSSSATRCRSSWPIERAVDHSEGVALATSIVGEHTEHSDKHVVATGHGVRPGARDRSRAVRVRSGRLETAAKRSPDQVSSIAAILKSTSPFARPAVRTACSVTSVRTPDVFFGQQIQRAFLSARFAMSATRAASSVAERTNQSVTSVWPRAERRSPTPGGRSGIVNSSGRPRGRLSRLRGSRAFWQAGSPNSPHVSAAAGRDLSWSGQHIAGRPERWRRPVACGCEQRARPAPRRHRRRCRLDAKLSACLFTELRRGLSSREPSRPVPVAGFSRSAVWRLAPGREAFALAGAGQVGMLRALCERGIVPDLVVGSSIGAVNAAFFAGEPTLEGTYLAADVACGSRPTTSSRRAGCTGRGVSSSDARPSIRSRDCGGW